MFQGRSLPYLYPITARSYYPGTKDQELCDRVLRISRLFQLPYLLSALEDPDTRTLSGTPCRDNLLVPRYSRSDDLGSLGRSDKDELETALDIVCL
jgi:hypothetical protein